MRRLSYQDLIWDSVYLRPFRYTLADGEKIPWGRSKTAEDLIRFDPEHRKAAVEMPAGEGKISDAGYDQMVCLAAAVPACDHILFRAAVRILDCPPVEEQNGQEGLGLFFRDTLSPEPLTGYPYSNMIAGGFFRGSLGVFGREGIRKGDVENVRPVILTDNSSGLLPYAGMKLEIYLEKQESGVTVTITPEGDLSPVRYVIPVREEIFSAVEPDKIYLGFLAARGCRMEIDTDSVAVEYGDLPEDGKEPPVLYVSPSGTGAGSGTQEDPLDLQAAVSRCLRGQEIRVMPGRYRFTEDLVIASANCGSVHRYKKIRADAGPGTGAVLDFGGGSHGFRIEGSFWDVSGISVTRGYGFMISGSGNRIRGCSAVANLETGFLVRHPSADSPKQDWPSDNEIADCISCLNMDPSQQHADGFACKVASGSGNRFIRCTAWMNSDDGFDLFCKNRPIGAVRLEECRSWMNGYGLREGRPVRTRGNGNGFKLGGSGMPADHEAVRCEAVGNRESGFTSNSNPCMRLYSCRAENNGKNFVYYFTGPEAEPVCLMENCTEKGDPGFDPAVWAKGHIDLRKALLLSGEETDEKPAVLIMCSSLYGGGAERVACRLAGGLTGHYQVFMLYIQDKGETYDLDPAVQVVAMPYFPCTSYEDLTEQRTAYVRRLKKDLNVTASISFMFTMNKLNVHSRGTEKVICSERNDPARRDPGRFGEIEGFYEAADCVVFQSESVRDEFSGKVRDHCRIIRNPVSVTCSRTGISHRIVNIGRLTPQKNQAMLLRAFAAFHRTHNEYTLSIYGEGELEEELQALADSLGLGNAVRFEGQVRDVHGAAADAEIFVLSSDYEGLSNALLECMIMGFPCISTRVPGSETVIRPGENGILVDVGSGEQLEAAMTLLADDEALREELGSRAKNIAEHYRPDRVIAQWEELISQLCGRLPDDGR